MEKMRKLKLSPIKQESDDTASSFYSNHSDIADDEDDPLRYLLSDDEDTTLIIDRVERTNSKVRQNGETGLHKSHIQDDVFNVREEVSEMTSDPDQAAKLMVQGMRDQLTPFQYNGTPFPARHSPEMNTQDYISENKVRKNN
jgi:hypothetical protein